MTPISAPFLLAAFLALGASPLLGAPVQEGTGRGEHFRRYERTPRQVSGRLTLKGGAALVGWTVLGSATWGRTEFSSREGIRTTTGENGAFAFEAPMTGWVRLRVDGPWSNYCFAATGSQLTPPEIEADIAVEGYLLQTPSAESGRARLVTAQPILWSNAELGGGSTAMPPIAFGFRASGGFAKALVPAGASYLVTKQRPGESPLVALVDGTRPASIVDVRFQESIPSLATFTVSISSEDAGSRSNLRVELRPIVDRAARVCTPRAADMESGKFRGAALPGRYRIVAWVSGRKNATYFVEGTPGQGEVILEAGKEIALPISLTPAGGVEVYPHWPSELRESIDMEDRAVQAEFRVSGTDEWMKARLLSDSWSLTRAPEQLGRMSWRRESLILERPLPPGEYDLRISLPEGVSTEARVVIQATGEFTPCHLAWDRK